MRFFLALGLAGCAFSPSLDGTFRCGAGGACPDGLVCATDGVCRAVSVGDAAPVSRGPGPPVDMAKKPHDDDPSDMSAIESPPDLSTPLDLAMCVPLACGGFCGQALDGCGGKIDCGKCSGDHMTCGGGGPNLCGPTDCHPASCGTLGAHCGFVSDNCAHVLDCGHCTTGQTCTQNQCS